MSRPSDPGSDPETAQQVGALCYRLREGAPQILLVTSRDTGRWIIPKGWPMDGLSHAESAAVEAWEEAGVTGRPRAAPIGAFAYLKRRRGKAADVPCSVAVFALEVEAARRDWPERAERRRRWMSRDEAAVRVDEEGLRHLLLQFEPKGL